METQKTILIVEDEKSLCDAIVDILRRKNYDPLPAKNGREGVELAFSRHPDLILLDLIMPEMDGMTALKKIRGDSWGAHVPVIILTNLNATSKLVAGDIVTQNLTNYLIKSDWRLHDVADKIGEVLKKNSKVG